MTEKIEETQWPRPNRRVLVTLKTGFKAFAQRVGPDTFLLLAHKKMVRFDQVEAWEMAEEKKRRRYG